MPVQTHFKIVPIGIFDPTPETWSFSLKYEREVGLGGDADLGQISDSAVTAALFGLFTNAQFLSNTVCTGWRAYVIGANGKMEGNPKIVDFAQANLIKGTGTRFTPLDQALCVTTEAANRGHARFGRFYLPGPATAVTEDGRLSVASAQQYVTLTTTFLKSVSDAIDLPSTPASSRMLNISNDVTSTWQQVRNIRIGRVYDRVSRRRRQLLEEYEASGTIDW